MVIETITIQRVDVELLDTQRKTLIEMLSEDNVLDVITPEQIDTIEGIISMLDTWSDSMGKVCTACCGYGSYRDGTCGQCDGAGKIYTT